MPRDGTRVERIGYAEKGRAPVRLLTVRGGGHVMPGDKKASHIMGRTSRGIRAVDEIAAFFDLPRLTA